MAPSLSMSDLPGDLQQRVRNLQSRGFDVLKDYNARVTRQVTNPQGKLVGRTNPPDPAHEIIFKGVDYDTLTRYENLRDTDGDALNRNYRYLIIKAGTNLMLQEGSGQHEVKFTNFGRHFQLWTNASNSYNITINAFNIGKWLASTVGDGLGNISYNNNYMGSNWYFKPTSSTRDTQPDRCYDVYVYTSESTSNSINSFYLTTWSGRMVGIENDIWKSGKGQHFSVKFQKLGPRDESYDEYISVKQALGKVEKAPPKFTIRPKM